MEGHTAYRQPMTVFWSRAQHQHHVTTSLMKLAVGERNVATNVGINYRLSKNIILVFKLPTTNLMNVFKYRLCYSLHQMHKIRHKGGVSVRTPRNLGFAHEVQCVSVTHGTYNYRIQKVK